MLLQPQHFQLESHFHQARFNRINHLTSNEYWGVNALEIDTDALDQHRFVINSGEFLFNDGSLFRVPQEASVLSREFDEKWIRAGQPFMVYLGIKQWKNNGSNACEVGVSQLSQTLDTRYVVSQEAETLPDLYGVGVSAQVREMR